mmetsp:Transcript_56192/g.180375  ORF Transcript_56192/g.180375 Transcript_56192/m.180375 type:complete len:238 (+) Transcript_56192:274-987(+)
MNCMLTGGSSLCTVRASTQDCLVTNFSGFRRMWALAGESELRRTLTARLPNKSAAFTPASLPSWSEAATWYTKPAMLCTRLCTQGPGAMLESHAESRTRPRSTSPMAGSRSPNAGWGSSLLLSCCQDCSISVQVMKPPLLKRCTSNLGFVPSGASCHAFMAALMATAHWQRRPKLAFMLQASRTISAPGKSSRYTATRSSRSPTVPPPQAKRKMTSPVGVLPGASMCTSLISRRSFA